MAHKDYQNAQVASVNDVCENKLCEFESFLNFD